MWMAITFLMALDLGLIFFTTFKCTRMARKPSTPPMTANLCWAMAALQLAILFTFLGRFPHHWRIRDDFEAGAVSGAFAVGQVASLVFGAVTILLALWLVTRAFPSVGKTERLARVVITSPFVDMRSSELSLTARELEVLEAMIEGRLSDQEIAEAFYISPSTAATHVRNILRKADLHNRRDLVLMYGASKVDQQ